MRKIECTADAASFLQQLSAATGCDRNASIARVCRTRNRATPMQRPFMMRLYSR